MSFAAPVSNVFAVGFLPKAHELFEPLRADPRELQYALRLIGPVGNRLIGEAAMGDYLGLYRWALPGEKGYFQISVGGGAFGRFNLASQTDDMESVDFFANVPFDLRMGRWSTRFMPYHTSSHLGDDYLKTTGQTTSKHSWDNLRWLESVDVSSDLRLYAGYTYVFRTLPEGIGRNALQAGVEMYSPWFAHGHAQVYWANDFQSWQRVAWNPQFTSQLGIKGVRSLQEARAMDLFLEFGAGRQPQGQFYLNHQTYWGLGIKFELS